MKPSFLLACFALFPLGCGGELPPPSVSPTGAPTQVAVAPSQHPAEVTTVDLTPPAPAAPAPAKPTPEELQAQRQSALKEAAEYGMMGLLGAGAGGDPSAPTAPWGKDDSDDPLAARGNMWGDAVGDSFGAGGLGLSGVSPSAGGTGVGLGIGSVGTLGHGAGTGTGQGFGSGYGGLGGSHRRNPPRIKTGATTVQGRLPPEVVLRIIRQNFGRFRLCYENGLRTNPKLEGKVTVHFVIENSGVVTSVSTAQGTDLKDKAMTKCLEKAFMTLSFPQPDGGKVIVNYPILFSLPDPAPKAPPAAPTPAPPATPAPAPAAAPVAPPSP
ncbi:MAG: AgmX/PglI C-terminal domain-containing protein [Byssovorax sp.]